MGNLMSKYAYQLTFVPGLLQTEAYARVLFEAGRSESVERDLKIRVNRQARLIADESPVQLHAVIHECAGSGERENGKTGCVMWFWPMSMTHCSHLLHL